MASKRKTQPRRRGDRGSLSGLRLIGMVHLPALPGSAGASMLMNRIIDRACSEAVLLAKAGFDAVIVENFGDAPFVAEAAPSETVAAMAIVVDRVVRACGVAVGVNVLRNDAAAGLAIAATAGADFIRVNVLSGVYATDQGFITGRAAEVAACRAAANRHIHIAADVHVKHAQPISQPDVALAAEETAYRAGGDAIILSGDATGSPTDREAVAQVRKAVPDRPLWIGSGVTAQTVGAYLDIADAVIVGTSIKRGGRTTNPPDPNRAAALVKAAQ